MGNFRASDSRSLFDLVKNNSVRGASLDAGRYLPALAEVAFYSGISLFADYSTVGGHRTGPAA